MAKKQKKIIIIDAFALIFRAYYALPPLARKDGVVVNAVYGFLSTLFNVIKDYKPEYLCVAFDSEKRTFRKEMFEAYKAHREAPPEDFKPQVPILIKMLDMLNIRMYALPGWEADDIIGSICAQKSIDNKDTMSYILTGDLDTLQLVDDNTRVITFKRGMSETIEYDEQAVIAKYDGLRPDQLIDMKALKGDQSDNIPGIKGIGEVTAIKLIKQFGSLDELYKNIDQANVSDRIKELIRNGKKDAEMSKKLSTIVTDLNIDFSLEDCVPKPFNKQAVITELQEMEFKSLIARIPDIGGNTSVNIEPQEIEPVKNLKYITIADQKSFDNFVEELSEQKIFSFNTETSDLDPFSAELMGISFAWEAGGAFYVSIRNNEGDGLFTLETDNSEWLKKLAPIFADEKVRKIAHNAKFDIEIFNQCGIEVKGLIFDTMIAAYLLNPGSRGYDLKSLAMSELGHKMVTYEDLVGKGSKVISIKEVPLTRLSYYSAEDADFTYRLFEHYTPMIAKHGLEKVLYELEIPLIDVLVKMEESGMMLDSEYLNEMSKDLAKRLEDLEKKIYKEAGREFNISSPNQLQEVLFDDLGLSTTKIARTKTGLSTAASELEKLQGLHPIIDMISDYRELSKLQSTYVEALPLLVNKKTGRLHTSFMQTIAATGRLSSTNPNLQNIPVRTDLGSLVRRAFIVPDGFVMLSADYSQIELRLAAVFSGDQTMQRFFKEGKDIHTSTAATIHGIPESEVTKQIRSTAKEVNFGIIYGLGSMGLAQRTGISRDEAKAFIEKYFENFPGMKKYLHDAVETAREKGYAETFFGRKRWLPDLKSTNGMMRSAAERIAVNTPLQGANADIIKLAMIMIQKELPKVSAKSKMILQIHDQLLFEVPNEDLEKVAKFVKETMENVYKFDVPIVADLSVGKNWGELKDYKE